MISSLKKPESEQNYSNDLIKASAKLGKAYSEAEIRLLENGLLQKNSVDMYVISVCDMYYSRYIILLYLTLLNFSVSVGLRKKLNKKRNC